MKALVFEKFRKSSSPAEKVAAYSFSSFSFFQWWELEKGILFQLHISRHKYHHIIKEMSPANVQNF